MTHALFAERREKQLLRRKWSDSTHEDFVLELAREADPAKLLKTQLRRRRCPIYCERTCEQCDRSIGNPKHQIQRGTRPDRTIRVTLTVGCRSESLRFVHSLAGPKAAVAFELGTLQRDAPRNA